MATALGKFLRKLRIDNDELMKDMADKLKLATSTLSSIENGRRNPPKGFEEKIIDAYALAAAEIEQLRGAIMQSRDEVALRIKGMSSQDQELAVSFARRFENLSEADKARIKEILSEND